MSVDIFKPTFIIQIEGKTLSSDITHEVTSLVFEDNEKEMDVLELSITNRNLQFVDHPAFQEGNEIVARFGYVNNLTPRKKTVIKEIDYDFPESGAPTIRIKAFDKGFKLAGKQNQKTWKKQAPGILYSEIAEEIAKANGLISKVTPTIGHHLRVVQSNVSDAQFLKDLAKKSRDKEGAGAAGYVFYVQDDELHFHPRGLEKPAVISLAYFTEKKGILRSFRPSTQSQGAKGAGVETKSVGVDPRKKEAVEHKANNKTTPDRTSLGEKTYQVDGNTGEGAYKEQESGQIEPAFDATEGTHEEPRQKPGQDTAESKFKEAELRQVEATATTIGMPNLRAKQNIKIRGVGRKFSGTYYCQSVRHTIDQNGYSCELKLKRNALGKGAGGKSAEVKGKKNKEESKAEPQPEMIRIDADSGKKL